MDEWARRVAGWRGQRVVLRYRTADGHLTDALGDLISSDDAVATVLTRRGEVVVPLARIVAGKPVPPPRNPPRRDPPTP